MREYFEAGDTVRVTAHHSAPGKGLTYGNHARVTLGEDCVPGSWDVVDVIAPDGEEFSVYAFSVWPE